MSLRSETRSSAFKRRVEEEHGNKCVNCGSSENIEKHHIVPILLGGTNRISNIVPLCHKCHEAAHSGRHISHYQNIKNTGRKPNLDNETAYKIFDMYINGEIGNRKCNEMFGYSNGTQIIRSPQFKTYMKMRGIKSVHNIIDVVATNSPEKFTNGFRVGEIVYEDGHKEDITYKDTGANNVRYTQRKNPNQS